MQDGQHIRMLGALAMGAILTLVTALRGGDTPRGSGLAASSRLVVVGVGRLSWESVLALRSRSELPSMARLLGGESGTGDLIGWDGASEREILASVLTGRFPFHHGIRDPAPSCRVDGQAHPDQRLVWDWLHRAGQRVAVVGFPLWDPMEGAGTLVMPTRLDAAARGVLFKDGAPWTDPAFDELIVRPSEVAPLSVAAVVRDLKLPGEAFAVLRVSMADDLTVTAMAERAAGTMPKAHLFVYLKGLSVLEQSLMDSSTPPCSRETADALVRHYHVFVDFLLGRLAACADAQTTFVLFSEEGNRRGPIHYRPRFPALDPWPPIGFFVAHGANIQRTAIAQTLAPVDVAITLLYLAGAPLPASMDGVILYGMLDEKFIITQPRAAGP